MKIFANLKNFFGKFYQSIFVEELKKKWKNERKNYFSIHYLSFNYSVIFNSFMKSRKEKNI